jgi:hypothetical protein
MRLLLLVPVLLLAAACGGGDDAGTAPGSDAGTDSLGGISQTQNDLVVEQDLGDGSAPQRWTLVCAGQVEGTHPDAAAACAHLSGLDDPFAPLPADQLCTELYGGPQTARITGVWGGEPVDLAVARTNGCEISQWDSLGPLLPGPVGVELPEDAPQ